MKKFILLTIVGIISLSAFAKNRNYLLYTDANVDRLKNQIEKDPVVKAAWEEQYNDAAKLTENSRLRANDCQTLGLAYRMTGEVRFAETIKKILLDNIKRASWEGKDLLSRTPPWRAGLKTSHTSFYIAIGFDCAYNYLTPKERKEIAEGIVRVGIKPVLEDWLSSGSNMHTFDTMGHNWWSACVFMAGFSSLAVQNEIPEAKTWAKEIAATATEWVNFSGSILQDKPRTFDKDGGYYESVGYASYGISQYLLFRYAFGQALPGVKQPDLPILEKTADYFINTTYFVDNGRPMSVNFGDSSMRSNGNACVKLLWNLGYQKERFAWYLDQLKSGENGDGLTLNSPNGLILNPDLPKLKEDYSPDLPVSQLYADMGWATLRDSWKNNATMLAVKCGMTWNHTHADAGSYILFHNGKNLIIDGGGCSYGNPLYTEYYCQSEAHNVVLFDGQGQNRRDPYYGVVNPGSLHNLVDGGDFKYLMANATGPYSHILERNYRHFIWVGDVILVIDDLLAYKPGKFEWLLHYNGESNRDGLDLSIKQDNAEVLVHPLFPETFPNGGLPHDFPEKMRLEEKLGYEDHHPEKRDPYWFVSHFEDTDRTKFITAIILKNEGNKDKLPTIERLQGENYLGVSITQHGETTNVYFNLRADGRLKHRNSLVNIDGWETDAYLTALKFKQGTDKLNPDNLKEIFIGHGSFLRRDGEDVIHALSKYTALVENLDASPSLIFEGQPYVRFNLRVPKKQLTLKVNGQPKKGTYDASSKTLQLFFDNDPASSKY